MRVGWFRSAAFPALAPPRPASAQQAKLFLEDIQDGVIDLGNGEYRGVLEISARNLDLASPEEQDQIVARFRAVLNSLSFPIQILVRIERLDVAGYLALLGERARATTQASLRALALAQLGFVRELAASRVLLERRFLLVIPSATPGAVSGSAAGRWLGLVHHPAGGRQTAMVAHRQIAERAAQVSRGLELVGVRARLLDTDEVLALYSAALCPTQARRQPVRQSLAAATTPAIRGPVATPVRDGGD